VVAIREAEADRHPGPTHEISRLKVTLDQKTSASRDKRKCAAWTHPLWDEVAKPSDQRPD
jgi:hypothetical protein